MELSGFRVWIHSDGEKLKEYSVEVSPDGKKAACWVPSQSGKVFAVEFEVGDSPVMKGRGKSAHFYVDGRIMKRISLLPHKTNGTVRGPRTSNNTMRPFKFADVRTTEAPLGDVRVNSADIGTIRVQVFLAESWKHRSHRSSKHHVQDHPPAVISEREKKAAEHCVSLGDEQPHRSSGGAYHMVCNTEKPDLVFEFRYRSMAMLQALEIAPPPKREAPPIIDVEDEDTLPPLKRQKREHDEDLMGSMQSELKKLWRRVGELEGKKDGPSRIKLKKAIKCDPADIIDLT